MGWLLFAWVPPIPSVVSSIFDDEPQLDYAASCDGFRMSICVTTRCDAMLDCFPFSRLFALKMNKTNKRRRRFPLGGIADLTGARSNLQESSSGVCESANLRPRSRNADMSLTMCVLASLSPTSNSLRVLWELGFITSAPHELLPCLTSINIMRYLFIDPILRDQRQRDVQLVHPCRLQTNAMQQNSRLCNISP